MSTQSTPQPVIDALHVIAAHLRDRGYVEAVVSHTGGATLCKARQADALLDGWEETMDRYLATHHVALLLRDAWRRAEGRYQSAVRGRRQFRAAYWRMLALHARWRDAYLLLDNAPDEATRAAARRLLDALTEEG